MNGNNIVMSIHSTTKLRSWENQTFVAAALRNLNPSLLVWDFLIWPHYQILKNFLKDNNAPCWKLKLLLRCYHSLLCCFPVGPNLTSARNQIQIAPARLNCWLLHSVHLPFKLPLIFIVRGSLKRA